MNTCVAHSGHSREINEYAKLFSPVIQSWGNDLYLFELTFDFQFRKFMMNG